jgi:hypothetical protein
LFSLELIGRLEFERLMETQWIVKGCDVLEHRYFGVIEILIALEFGPFMLRRCFFLGFHAPARPAGAALKLTDLGFELFKSVLFGCRGGLALLFLAPLPQR